MSEEADPEEIPAGRQFRMCARCGAGENPRSPLAFFDSPSGALCQRCFERHHAPPIGMPGPDPVFGAPGVPEHELRLIPTAPMLVIPCPTCGGKPSSLVNGCATCCGYGRVRVAENAIPIYIPTTKLPPPPEETA